MQQCVTRSLAKERGCLNSSNPRARVTSISVSFTLHVYLSFPVWIEFDLCVTSQASSAVASTLSVKLPPCYFRTRVNVNVLI